MTSIKPTTEHLRKNEAGQTIFF